MLICLQIAMPIPFRGRRGRRGRGVKLLPLRIFFEMPQSERDPSHSAPTDTALSSPGLVVSDPAPTDLDPIKDKETFEASPVDEIMPSDSHDLAIVSYEAREILEGRGFRHAPEGSTVSAILQRLEELVDACSHTRVRLPHLDMRVLRHIDSDVWAPQLQELLDDLIVPCLDLARSISWERIAEGYDHLERAHFAHSQALSRAEADFMHARQALRHVESQLTHHVAWQARIWALGADHETLRHLAERTVTLEQEVGDASQVVHHVSAIFLQHFRAHEAAGVRFVRMADFERLRRSRAEDLLARIARALAHLSFVCGI